MMTTFKDNPQTCFIADGMEAFQERMLKEFADLHAMQGKWEAVEGICA